MELKNGDVFYKGCYWIVAGWNGDHSFIYSAGDKSAYYLKERTFEDVAKVLDTSAVYVGRLEYGKGSYDDCCALMRMEIYHPRLSELLHSPDAPKKIGNVSTEGW